MIDRILGSAPVPVGPHVFSLSDEWVTCAHILRAPAGRLSVEAFGEAVLGPEVFSPGPLGGMVRDPATLERVISELAGRLGPKVERASLVLPDRWIRLVFAEVTELPQAAAARQDALRFKLRQLVPFRPEDLRVSALPVAPLAAQEEPRRLALAVGSEALMSEVERCFERAGVRIGWMCNRTLALSNLLPESELGLLVAADEDCYSVLVAAGGEPVLLRFKELGAPGDSVLEHTVRRELQLTISFLEERLPGRALDQVWVAAAEGPTWSDWIGDALGADCLVLSGADHLSSAVLPSSWSWQRAGALLGAALQEVA